MMIDSREDSVLSELVIQYSLISNVTTEKVFLEVGDYITGDVCIEAKSVEDFLQSVRNKRMFNQISNMEDSYVRNYIVIYGNLSDAGSYLNHVRSNFNDRSWRLRLQKMFIGALSSIALNTKTTPVWVADVESAAHFIVACEHHCDKEIDLQKMLPKKTRTDDVRLDILCTIQGVTIEKARTLLAEFGSLLEIATCEVKEIMKLKGIGKVTATNISNALNKEEEVKY